MREGGLQMKSFVFAALLVAVGQAGAQTPAKDSVGFHPTDYDVRIDLPDSGATINGDATLTFSRAGALDTLSLDLIKLRVTGVSIDGRATQFGQTDSSIRVVIPRSTARSFKVRVVYTGAVTDGLIARRDSLGRWTYFGDNWPTRARYWIPSIDRPGEKATISWTVTAPAGYTVVANGTEIESRVLPMAERRRVLSRWRESKPISPYLMVIAAAPLVRVDLGQTACGFAEVARCVPQAVYAAPENRSVLPGAFSRAGDIVQFYASVIAPFPYEKLDHLQSETRYGGMENATAIFYADEYFHRDGVPEFLIAHETAHQWFGDAVTEREWPHVWLSEGFATYFAALYTQHAHGDSAFRAELRRIRSQILADTVAVPKRPVIDTIETDLLALLNVNSYQKGAWVLHMLRSELGDSAFFRGLRDYYSKHKNGAALTDDLRKSLEQASGRDLRHFFDQWLRRPGFPEIEVTWKSDSTGTYALVTQSGRFGYFDFSLPIVVVGADNARRPLKIPVNAAPLTRFKIADPGVRVARVEVDPDVTVLMK
jgi:aminopeptidase N